MIENLPKISNLEKLVWSYISNLQKLQSFQKFKNWVGSLNLNEPVYIQKRKVNLSIAGILSIVLLTVVISGSVRPMADLTAQITSDLISPLTPLQPLEEAKSNNEVFGFAPYWTIDNLSNVDFDTLTTLAYFDVPVMGSGELDRNSLGYQTFKSKKATNLFKKAHSHGTRVVLTITQMKNAQIIALLDSPGAQDTAISQITQEVKDRGIDGINIDIEYNGNPGPGYKDEYSKFVANLTKEMHAQVPGSYVTASVYASSANSNKLYDIAALSKSTDGIFMMAYDFAVAGSDHAIPTAPLYGYKEGKYWYDISTAVDDFLSQMPADKLILGVPWYGYNYVVYQPEVKSATFPSYSWRGRPATQTYAIAQENIHAGMDGIKQYKEGWDDFGKVGYKAYYVAATNTWRMVFIEDPKSLGIKYDFAKDKKLGGVGMWALGFDRGSTEMWDLLREKFGYKLASTSLGGNIR